MKTMMTSFIAFALLSTSSFATADVMQVWNCKLKEGKTEEELEASSRAWLAAAKKSPGNENVEAWHLYPVVSERSDGEFVFVSTVPDFESWGKAADAYPGSDEAAADDAWNELVDCKGTSVWYTMKIE